MWNLRFNKPAVHPPALPHTHTHSHNTHTRPHTLQTRVHPCISFLLSITNYHKFDGLKYRPFISGQFHGSDLAQPGLTLCWVYHKAEIKVSVEWVLIWGSGRISKLIQVIGRAPFPAVVSLQSAVFTSLLAVSWGQFLAPEATYHPALSLPHIPSLF